MKSLFILEGQLKKVGDVKSYTKKLTGEEDSIQNYSVNGIMFSMFGERQISFFDEMVGQPVVAFGRIELKEYEGNWKKIFHCDSLRKDYSKSE